MVENGKQHTSAICSIGAVLLSRIAACLRKGESYVGTPEKQIAGRLEFSQRPGG
jgi:hypothetical protein